MSTPEPGTGDTELLSRWAQVSPDPYLASRLTWQNRQLWRDHIGANAIDEGLVIPGDVFARAVEKAQPAMSPSVAYCPHPSGRPRARAAIADYYCRRSHETTTERIHLTPGTTMGYAAAIRLLCRRGDNILVPSPGYPLFDDICALCGVEPRRYHLRKERGGWTIDPEEVAFQVTPHTRAIAVVSPHNPTGMVASNDCLTALAKVCRDRDLALFFDEVFCEFVSGGGALSRPIDSAFPLCLTLNGFSKMLSLPAWKIAWVKVGGEPKRVAKFEAALEHYLDTFLAMPEFNQALVEPLLEQCDPGVLASIAAGVESLRMEKALALGIDDPGAGTYLCLPLSKTGDEVDTAQRLLEEHGIETHPGTWYDMPGHLILSCFTRPGGLDKRLELFREWANNVSTP